MSVFHKASSNIDHAGQSVPLPSSPAQSHVQTGEMNLWLMFAAAETYDQMKIVGVSMLIWVYAWCYTIQT